MLGHVGGVAAILTAALLLTGLLGWAIAPQGLGPRNWLVVLFQINAGINHVSADMLRLLNPLDVAILAFVGLTYLGLRRSYAGTRGALLVLAAALPFIGIPVLLVTGLAGRSSVMAAGVVAAATMLRSRDSRRLGYLGLLANGLLLAGDVMTGASQAPFVAALLGFGYLLLLPWFLMVGIRLLREPPGV
jgi:hypothetical protein